MSDATTGVRTLDPHTLSARERYQLLTSLVVPRPIAWVGTYGASGTPNLAPFSYFAALSASPMLLGISIGNRGGAPKDSLVNIRARGAFCVMVVSETFLEPMNATSAGVDPSVDEFELAGLRPIRSPVVDAPFVEGCPAVLECVLDREVDLGDAPNTLVIGRVVGLRVSEALPRTPDSAAIDPEALRPVGRLGGWAYALPGEVRSIPRPD